jgi:hypothetical protein
MLEGLGNPGGIRTFSILVRACCKFAGIRDCGVGKAACPAWAPGMPGKGGVPAMRASSPWLAVLAKLVPSDWMETFACSPICFSVVRGAARGFAIPFDMRIFLLIELF